MDEHGDDTSTTTETHGGDELTVEVDGESYEVEENYDYDHDGHNDTAVVETDDGHIAFADTDGDGAADVAVQFDHDGNVVSGAEFDESSGEWKEEDVNSLPTPSGDGADGHAGGAPHKNDTDHSGGTPKGGSTETGHSGQPGEHSDEQPGGQHGSGEDITVHTKSGEFDAGQAEYDSDGDGTNDTAIVTDKDGTTYAFTDADGNGTADTAVVIEADGDVTVTANKGGEDWEVTERGHLDADGTYHADSPASGSDSVWAESR
ncbi:MAG: hypothetical protein ACJ72N_18545 [Labedaea sp.]